MDHSLFYEITGVLLVAGLIATLISLLKQPSIIAFILTGLIVGPLGYYRLQSTSVLNSLGEIGITLLLFMVGLELDLRRIKELGTAVVTIGMGQILFTCLAGFGIVKLFGFSTVSSVYVAIALTFSSTIIVVKLLGEKRDLQSLYGRMAVGFLVVQDFVAMLILLFLGGSSAAQSNIFGSLPIWQIIIITLIKALIFFLLLFWLSKKVFPWLLHYLGRSDELLLSFSLAWALGLAAFASLPWVGFSLEMGGFLAGLALANSEMHWEISARVKSIRDFFIIIFFIVFGTQLVLGNISHIIWIAIILSLFVLIVKPLVVMFIMGYLGYKPKTSFFAGSTLAQVSEFSLILVALGFRLGQIDQSVLSLITLVGLVTIGLSSYLILYSQKIYEWLKIPLLYFDFHRGNAENAASETILKKHVVLIGVHRLGQHLIASLEDSNQPMVVVDLNPELAQLYEGRSFQVICGDITDPYIQDQVNIENAKLVISTIPNLQDNLALLDAVKRRTANKKSKPKLIFAAQDETEARHLYEHQIDYVVSPHFISGMHLADMIEGDHLLQGLRKLKQNHLKIMNG